MHSYFHCSNLDFFFVWTFTLKEWMMQKTDTPPPPVPIMIKGCGRCIMVQACTHASHQGQGRIRVERKMDEKPGESWKKT